MSTTDRREKNAEVVIAGAGIIGLSIALELATAGKRVLVMERGKAMSEASWAAAGMLAGRDPENPRELHALCELSLRLYPGFLDRVERCSGFRVPLRTRQTIQVLEKAPQLDTTPALLTDTETETLASGLRLRKHHFIELAEDSIDPRDLCRALPAAVRGAGADIREGYAVQSVSPSRSGVRVKGRGFEFEAGDLINCCGAWAGALMRSGSAEQSEVVTPRKGQMVRVSLPEGVFLRATLRTPQVYLVPRGDGHVVVGATVEDAGLDKSVDPTAVRELLERAATLWPPVARAKIVDSWAGIRPGTPDDLPVIGQVDHHCWIATGHFRNGILLAPGTARVLTQLLAGQASEVDLQRFAPERFRGMYRPEVRESDKSPIAAL